MRNAALLFVTLAVGACSLDHVVVAALDDQHAAGAAGAAGAKAPHWRWHCKMQRKVFKQSNRYALLFARARGRHLDRGPGTA